MKSSFITYLVILVPLSVTAQAPLPRLCYKHLSGMAGKNTQLTMNLVKVNDSLYGDYSVKITGAGDTHPPLMAEKSTVFCGKMTSRVNFRIMDWPGDKGVSFKGQFKDEQHISGTIENIDGKGKPVTFQLGENYPEGTIPFQVYFSEDEIKLTNNKTPRAMLKVALLLPAAAKAQAGSDSLRRLILSFFKVNHRGNESPENILTDIRQDYKTEYVTGNQSLYLEMPGASFEWELLKFAHIIYNSNHKVSFGIITYSFTGGAHGLTIEAFTTVDLKTGKTIRLPDLCKAGYEDELARLLTQKLHTMIDLSQSKKLSEAGYFTDEIKPTENFYLNENGIGFAYNHYEIAPYSFGITDIFLTSQELKGILKQP